MWLPPITDCRESILSLIHAKLLTEISKIHQKIHLPTSACIWKWIERRVQAWDPDAENSQPPPLPKTGICDILVQFSVLHSGIQRYIRAVQAQAYKGRFGCLSSALDIFQHLLQKMQVSWSFVSYLPYSNTHLADSATSKLVLTVCF